MDAADQEKVSAVLRETVSLLCRSAVTFQSDIRIQGLLGVTVDGSQVFLIPIDETVAGDKNSSFSDFKTGRLLLTASSSSVIGSSLVFSHKFLPIAVKFKVIEIVCRVDLVSSHFAEFSLNSDIAKISKRVRVIFY